MTEGVEVDAKLGVNHQQALMEKLVLDAMTVLQTLFVSALALAEVERVWGWLGFGFLLLLPEDSEGRSELGCLESSCPTHQVALLGIASSSGTSAALWKWISRK